MDTQREDQKKRARLYRPTGASGSVNTVPEPEVVAIVQPARSAEAGAPVRRETFVAPVIELELDSLMPPAAPLRHHVDG